MTYGRSGGGPQPTGNGDPKPIYRDPKTGSMTSKPPSKSAEPEPEMEAG